MSFGPGPEVFDDDPTGGYQVTIQELALVGLAGLTDLDLIRIGEHTLSSVPLEDPGGRKIGTVSNVHYSQSRRALIGEVATTHTYKTDELTTVIKEDKSKVDKVVLVR